jgi:ATP-dependent exoDNAse (exonuclease V) alpha subunit
MIRELDQVVLTVDLRELGLVRGDIGTVVLLHGEEGYEVEFVALDGETIAIASLATNQVRAIGPREIAQARAVEPV